MKILSASICAFRRAPTMERLTWWIGRLWASSATSCTKSAKNRKPTMYFPILEGRSDATLAVHTATDPLPFSVPLQKQIASLDPELPVSDVLTMNQIIGASLVNASLSATLVLAFAILSLILASVGLYGVLSYLTTQRTSELGIRMALGAQRDQLLQLMLMDGLRPALFGLGLGLVMSFAATRIFQSMLFGTKPLVPRGGFCNSRK